MPATHILKRTHNYTEAYDKRKLFASVYAACLSIRTPAGEAELTADKVCQNIAPWLHSKPEVTSTDIRHQAAQLLKLFNPDAAYMYLRHPGIIW